MNSNEIYEKFLSIKKENCFGCINDLSSQKDHDCLTNLFDDYYWSIALDTYFLEGKLSAEEYLALKNGTRDD